MPVHIIPDTIVDNSPSILPYIIPHAIPYVMQLSIQYYSISYYKHDSTSYSIDYSILFHIL